MRSAKAMGLLLVGLAASVTVSGIEPVVTGWEADAATARFFAASSPFNRAIPASPAVAPKGAPVIAALTAKGAVANLVQYGVPIYTASASTPRRSVTCSAPASWGRCPLTGKQVPIASTWRPSPGSDGAMVVVDRTAGVAYEFWRAKRSGTSWTTSWGSISSLTGSGWRSTATGSGASRLGGVVRTSELKAGLIPHALVLQTDLACAGRFRAPATKTDGPSRSAACIPEGSRVQLAPGADLSKLRGAQLTIAKALQRYGAYVVDKADTRLSVSFELTTDGAAGTTGAAYRSIGLTKDYQRLSGIPWKQLRLLQRWTGK